MHSPRVGKENANFALGKEEVLTCTMDSICLRSGSNSCGCLRVNRGISSLLSAARKLLLKGSAGHSAVGSGNKPLESFPCIHQGKISMVC